MKLKLEIPDYVSIDSFRRLSTLEHLSAFNKLIETIHIFTDIDRDEIRTWDLDSITKINQDLQQPINVEGEFYPIIEFNGELLGYSSIKKMTGGEYADLEGLCKNPLENLEQIIALLYRPITEHNLDTLKFHVKNGIKIAKGNLENIFDYYTIEKYNSDRRKAYAHKFKGFPVQYANGALSFFLGTATMSLSSTKHSSDPLQRSLMKEMKKEGLNLLGSITGGLVPFITYQKALSLTSQEVKVL